MQHPNIPVLVMSGHAEDDSKANIRNLSGRLLKKPFGPPQLLAKVREALAGAATN
jgi:DNA-binding response OmpR family regulator